MKKPLWVALGLAALAFAACAVGAVLFGGRALACGASHPDNLIGCTFAPTMQLTVDVTGNVDEVVFYSTGSDTQPVGRITTNGKDTTQTIGLSTSPPYYFVVRQGTRTNTSRVVGFDTMQASAHLTIRGLDQWEGW